MTKQLSITIADIVYEKLHKTKPNNIGLSEHTEELIRIGLRQKGVKNV